MFIHAGLSIRATEATDLEFLKNLRNDPDTWYNLSDIRMLTMRQQELWYQNIALDPKRLYFIVTDRSNNEEIGMIRCDEIDYINSSMRVGADVVVAKRRQGYGTRIYQLLLRYCFDFLNMHRVWLQVLDYNQAGIKLYQNVGFREEGRLRQAIYRDGQYHDYIIMSILDDEYHAL